MDKILKGNFIEVGSAESLEAKSKALSEGKFLSFGDGFVKIGVYKGKLTEFSRYRIAKYDEFYVRDDSLNDFETRIISFDKLYEWIPKPEGDGINE